VCDSKSEFRRGHETCYSPSYPIRLMKADRQKKGIMQATRLLVDDKLTDVGFLLEVGPTRESCVITNNSRGKNCAKFLLT